MRNNSKEILLRCPSLIQAGVIKSDYCRHPIAELHPDKRKYLLELAKNLNLVALRWGK